VIGISTGGPQALSQVFPLLAAPIPPILVVQHMLAEFTGVFAQRLDRYTSPTIKVKQAEEGDAVLPDRILIAPGGRHLSLAGRPPRVRVATRKSAATDRRSTCSSVRPPRCSSRPSSASS
jgi:two-component system chemotaxis response regulator CheB